MIQLAYHTVKGKVPDGQTGIAGVVFILLLTCVWPVKQSAELGDYFNSKGHDLVTTHSYTVLEQFRQDSVHKDWDALTNPG